MNRYFASILLIFIFCLSPGSDSFPCTGVTSKTLKGVLVGSNEDYNSTYKDIIARIYPAQAGKYGYLATGFQRHSYFMMGLNDQGLFLDMFTLPNVYQWVRDPKKQDYNGSIEQKIMEECATVEQAITLLNRYNNPSMGAYPYQIFVVDSAGNSAVICWADGKIESIRKKGDFQVVTNFYLKHPERGWYPCWRYSAATEQMEQADEFSFRLFRDILNRVNLGSNYSQICNISKGEIYIFNNHTFDEFVTLNIKEELQKGWHEIFLPDYFSNMKLISPEDKEDISDSKVTLKWQGDISSAYKIFLSIDPNFTNCKPIKVSINPTHASFGSNQMMLVLALCLMPISLMVFRRKSLHGYIIFFLMLCLIISCQQPDVNNVKIDYANQAFSVTIDEVPAGVTYYWKIIATADSALDSESIVWTFST